MLLKKIIKRLKALFGGKKDHNGNGDHRPPVGTSDDQRIALRAVHFPDGSEKLQEIESPVEYAFPRPKGPLSNVGRPITLDTARRFIQEFVSDKDIDQEDVAAITFDKDVLLLLLAQSECEGIRFYFGKFPESEDMTLVLVGVDKNGNDLGTKVDLGAKGKSLFSAQPKEEKLEFSEKRSYAAARIAGEGDGAEPTLMFEVGGHLKVRDL